MLRQQYSESHQRVGAMRTGAMSANDTLRRIGDAESAPGRRYSESHRSIHPGDPDYAAGRKEAMDFSMAS
jgi:hypothetical protein